MRHTTSNERRDALGPRVLGTAINDRPTSIESIASAVAQGWPIPDAEANTEEIQAVSDIQRLFDDRRQTHQLTSRVSNGQPPTVGGFELNAVDTRGECGEQMARRLRAIPVRGSLEGVMEALYCRVVARS
jgi:hypothetical protein